jgi:molybdopterin/thiamine biosynthesis adenylyltransferase
LADPDRVELSNLQRQILHTTSDRDRQKVDSAKEKLSLLNPDVEVVGYATRVEQDNAAEIFSGYDFIVDGSDNFATKFLVNDMAVNLGIPFSHAGIVRLQGQTMTIVPGKSACYRCFFREPPPPEEILTCQQAGILGAVAGTVGSIQAIEAIKYLAGLEEGLLTDRLLTFDARWMKFHLVPVKRDVHCVACSPKEPPH